MKKIICSLIFALLCSGLITVSAVSLTPVQKQQIIADIDRKASELKSMSCTFTQTKYLYMLNDKMVSKGKMLYKQSDKLRWEYTSPYRYLFIFNGNKVYVGNNSRKDVIDTNSNKVFREVARIMMNTVTGKALANPADFTVGIDDNSKTYAITLIPKKKEIKRMFSKIVLSFSKSTILISEIDIYEKNGDRTNIVINNINTDTTVNESSFNIPE